ncbi:hypothetical protein L3V86_03615 [Thiotrichales bacterium 19S11-10]|nr:hypothetical protein [Thiotrichales bacterium 19S11-10]MCF6806884.1 hypothetical protein [Thiotrichales bacterium 19S9-11]MCF6810853.1 hypothetical protein [Thiotrichales bacterium 19S9-12]
MLLVSLSSLIPHKAPMRLIDYLVEANDQQVTCQSLITPEHLFYDKAIDGIWHWVGIEMMAQASAVLAQFQSGKDKDQSPRLGFLLSVRQFKSSIPYFTSGLNLTIMAKKIYIDSSLGSFNGAILVNDKEVATAKLSAIEPTDEQLDQILQG